jgi:3-mercaptopyruvate sulfurtransferase SseA
MKTISREELKTFLDRREPVQVVMTLSPWAYNRLHIPGSVGIERLAKLISAWERDQELVVYDSNPACPASYRAYYLLESLGFTNVRRFAGGIEEWLEAGYPVEGSLAEEQAYAAA